MTVTVESIKLRGRVRNPLRDRAARLMTEALAKQRV